MNIGIIIGVSEYSDTANNLPGCKIDAQHIHTILNKSNKYDELLVLDKKMTSAVLKEKLTDFIAKNRANDIDELFFYFTGHGQFHNEEFYYLLSDYHTTKRKQTTLQNEEVDILIKTLNPKLVIKVIDACQSGKNYIKEPNVMVKYFEKTGNKFNNCYFLNSSLSDQSSYQSEKISDFTLSFIESIKKHQSNEIRYKDIIDYISDEFETNADQTPFFVIQADLTEKFCQINPSLKEFLKSIDFKNKLITVDKEKLSIIDKIKKESTNYKTKEQAIDAINDLKVECEKFELEGNLKELFNLNISFYDDYSQIIKKNVIGKWLEDNDHDFFASSSYKRVRKDRNSNPFGHLTIGLMGARNLDTEEYEKVRDGFDLDIEVPYKTIIFDLDSKYPNVESFSSRVIYLISKRKIGFFYFVTNFDEKNWDEKNLNTDIEWFYSEKSINSETKLIDALKEIFNKLENRVNAYLKETFENNEK
jgi:hypothetical protein